MLIFPVCHFILLSFLLYFELFYFTVVALEIKIKNYRNLLHINTILITLVYKIFTFVYLCSLSIIYAIRQIDSVIQLRDNFRQYNAYWWWEIFFHKMVVFFWTTVIFLGGGEIAVHLEISFIYIFCSLILWHLFFFSHYSRLCQAAFFSFLHSDRISQVFPSTRVQVLIFTSVWTLLLYLYFQFLWLAFSFI